ncbi:MAG: hypothetical protein ACRELB_06545, partial [Polyangiaceae bacterium]
MSIRMPTPTRRAVLAVSLTLLAALAVPVFAGGDKDPAAQVAAAVGDMEHASGAEIFSISRGLDALGAGGVAAAKTSLATASPRARVGLARYLLAQKERDAAIASLEKTVTSD